MRSDGRPSLYTKKELLDVLIGYQKNHPNEKITYSKLEKETGIRRHIWKYQMEDVINARNSKLLESNIPEQQEFELPSVAEIMKSCGNNPDELENYLIVLTGMVYDLYQYKDSKNTLDAVKNEYDEKIRALELQLGEQKKINANQQDVINKYILSSASQEKRNQQQIKSNIIEFSRDNLNRYDEMFKRLTQ